MNTARPSLEIVLLFVVLLNCADTFGQYSLTSSLETFTPVVGGTVISMPNGDVDQGVSGVVPIGFTFNYFGMNYTSLQATSDGFISFNTLGNTIPFGPNLIQNSPYLKAIAPLWDDLAAPFGSVSYVTTGSAPNRVLTVQWLNTSWTYAAVAAGISFQVKLFESTNSIQFIYQPEAGALYFPSASAGLIGNSLQQFYSLSDLSASATLSQGGVNTINAKPLAGQGFLFTPLPPANVPTVQTSGLSATNVNMSSLTLNWTNGNGESRAVFMKLTTAAESVPVTDNNTYGSNGVFSTPAAFVAAGWYCVYKGTGNTTNVTGLASGSSYRIQVLEFNGPVGGEKYLSGSSSENSITVLTPLSAPVGTPSTLELKSINGSQLQLDILEGIGEKRIVMIKQSDSGSAPVVDNTTYTANLNFMAGSQIGTSGWFCIFNGVSSSQITVTGLSGNKPYRIQVIDYNGPPGAEKYHLSPATPLTAVTFESHSLPNYTFTATGGAFSPLEDGTPVDAIEYDDALSSVIPIGFTFHFAAIPFTQLVASSNGFLSFNPYASNNSSGLENNLSSAIHRPLIAPLWDDLGGFEGQASYRTDGLAPNRVFTFEWLNWRWNYAATGAVISFQVKLYEADNKIEFIYRQESGATSFGSASIGLAFPNTGNGNFLSLINSSASPTLLSNFETQTIDTKPASDQVYSFVPQKLNQAINFPSIPDKFYGNTPFDIAPSTPSGLPITVMSSNPNVATVSNNQVTIVGVGSVTLTASQSGNIIYNAASDVQRNFIVNKGNQTINFSPLAPRAFRMETSQLSASVSSGLSITFESADPAVATVSGNTVTYTGVGTTEITALQAGNSFYNAATPVVRTMVVTKGSQTISFPSLPVKYVDEGSFTLTGDATSSLPVTYMSSDEGVATVSGTTVTITGAGTTQITAKQSGNSNWEAAPDVIRPLTVSKRNQVIEWHKYPSFNPNTNAHVKFGDEDFTISASATSLLPMTYTSSNSDVATVEGNVVKIHGAGTTIIKALQAGNNAFNNAELSSNLVVLKAEQSIAIEPIVAKVFGDAPFAVVATATSGLPVVLAPVDNADLSVAGNTVTMLRSNKVTLSATQGGNSNYYSKTEYIDFCVNAPKPFILLEESTFGNSVVTLKLRDPIPPGSTVNWYRGQDIVQSEAGAEIQTSVIGNYTAVIQVGGDCYSQPSEVFSLIVTSLSDQEQAVWAYPNPTTSLIKFSFTNDQAVRVAVLDVLGREVMNVIPNNREVDISHLTPGIYTVVITIGRDTHLQKIVKQ